MRNSMLAFLAIGTVLTVGTAALGQQPPGYGAPGVTLDQAKKAVQAAEAEATKNGWRMAIAVVSIGGYLIHFSRIDDTQFGSNDIAIHKAKTAAMFRRPSKAFQDALTGSPPALPILTLDGVIAAEGGLPLIANGKVVGAIGCSGGTGAQDSQACKAGADTIN